MISITEKAVGKLKEMSEEYETGHLTVRLKVVGAGCAGFSYDMMFDDIVSESDETLEQDGIKVVIDPVSFQYLENVTIDYVDGLMGAGFKFLNPDVKASCGCGSSFDM